MAPTQAGGGEEVYSESHTRGARFLTRWTNTLSRNAGVNHQQQGEFIQNRARARRHSSRDGTNTLSRNAGLNQSDYEIRTPGLLRVVRHRQREKMLGRTGREEKEYYKERQG